MAFTEFCCKTGGSNLNAGTLTGNATEPGTAASFTYASGTWVQSTGVFTVASGDPAADGVAVGDFASVYPDGSTVGVFVGRITARDATTITVSLVAKMGTAPTDGTNTRTLKVGGAWLGPNAASAFPFGVIISTLTNAAGDFPRVNFKNSANFAITAAMAHTLAGPCTFEGYTTSYGDGGRAIIDGTIVGASYILFALNAVQCIFKNLIFQNNGTTGSANGVNLIGNGSAMYGCVINNVRGNGIQNNVAMIECEVYACNTSNTADFAGCVLGDRAASFTRCIIHDNAGSNTSGIFASVAGGTVIDCILDTNGKNGLVTFGNNTWVRITGSSFYNNGGHGIQVGASTNVSSIFVENSSFVKNGLYGIAGGTSGFRAGLIKNCGFGAGTQANVSGTTNSLGAIVEEGSVNFPNDVTPWVDPADGDFRINLTEAKQAGRGAFTQTQSGYGDPNPTVAFNDIGAARHADPVGGGRPEFRGSNL